MATSTEWHEDYDKTSEFLAEGLTIVMATPYLDEAERCGRVALLHAGRLLALDRPGVLQSALEGQLLEVVTNTARPPIEVLARTPGVADVQSFGDRAHVRVAGVTQEQAVPAIMATLQQQGIPVVSVRPVAASLEDVFIELVTRA